MQVTVLAALMPISSPGARGPRPRALVPQGDGRAALEALVGPLAGYEVEKATPPPPDAPPIIEHIRLPVGPILLFDQAEEVPHGARAPSASTRSERAGP
jgi:hypothetical protein